MNKKILLISDPNSSYTAQYIENVLEPLGFETWVLDGGGDTDQKFGSFLKEHNVHFLDLAPKKNKITTSFLFARRLSSIIAAWLNKKNIPQFDFIHVHFVSKGMLLLALMARKRNTKMFATFWGSDMLRRPEKYLKSEIKYLKKFNFISTLAFFLQNRLELMCPELKEKSGMIAFGVSLLSYIDKYSADACACKSFYDFPRSKKIVAVGYNATKEQQHDKVVEALERIKNKNDYFLVFHMSYGHSDTDYEKRLAGILRASGFEYKIIADYLSMDDVAKLRVATDVYINAQTTDAFSNAVIECIHAKAQIINASWLHYPEIDMFPLYVNEFSDFDEIPELLTRPISGEKLEWNKKKIKEETTWETCRNKWAGIYGVNAANDSLSNG